LALGRFFLTRKPVVAAMVISLWILTGIGLMALVTVGLLWIGLHVPQLFPNLPTDTIKEVCAVTTGALTTFAGVVVTKNMEEGGGFFWPGGQFHDHVGKVFKSAPYKPPGDSDAYKHAFFDRVDGGGPQGWGFVARRKRAKVLQAWIESCVKPKTPPPPPPPPPNVDPNPNH
jgi:hypothetical protein